MNINRWYLLTNFYKTCDFVCVFVLCKYGLTDWLTDVFSEFLFDRLVLMDGQTDGVNYIDFAKTQEVFYKLILFIKGFGNPVSQEQP